jgi:formylglycine-generating enzyme required for sulfatase activity
MKVEITQERSFTVRAGSKAIHGLLHVSDWEGFTKYEDAKGGAVFTRDGQLIHASADLAGVLGFGSIETGFVLVPEVTLPGGLVVPSFYVAQYAASKSDDGKAIIDASRKPWTNINFSASKAACAAAGYSMITETQWLAIAYNASQQAINWTGGAVGDGDLFQGYRNGSGPLAGDTTIGNTDTRRWLELSNGSRVYDFNGNVFQWIFDDVQGSADGLIEKKITLESPSMATAPHPSHTKGMGWRPSAAVDWSGSALIRGGCWDSGDYAGVFDLGYDWPGGEDDDVGFRCTKSSPGL